MLKNNIVLLSQIHYMDKVWWTPNHHTFVSFWASHSKPTSINMELAAFCGYSSLICSGKAFGLCMWEFDPIQSKEHLLDQVLMLKTWLVISIQMYSEGVQ